MAVLLCLWLMDVEGEGGWRRAGPGRGVDRGDARRLEEAWFKVWVKIKILLLSGSSRR